MKPTNQRIELHKEDGMVAIIVTMFIMIVLAIIVIGLTQLARREQSQALDRQLSTQAFYAAESGINDVVSETLADRTDCNAAYKNVDGTNNNNMDPTLDGSSGIQYTCLLVSSSGVPYLDYNPVGNENIVARVTNTNLAKIRISWAATSGSKNLRPNGYTTFAPDTNTGWGDRVGVIRFSITPLDNINRNDLIANTFTAFLYPDKSIDPNNPNVAPYTPGPVKQGQIISGKCNPDHDSNKVPLICNVEINRLGSHNSKGFALAFRSIYNDSHVIITGYLANGKTTPLNGAQMIVDSTGKANDVLRRIQVRVPINHYLGPNAALWSTTDICKQLIVYASEIRTMGCNAF